MQIRDRGREGGMEEGGGRRRDPTDGWRDGSSRDRSQRLARHPRHLLCRIVVAAASPGQEGGRQKADGICRQAVWAGQRESQREPRERDPWPGLRLACSGFGAALLAAGANVSLSGGVDSSRNGEWRGVLVADKPSIHHTPPSRTHLDTTSLCRGCWVGVLDPVDAMPMPMSHVPCPGVDRHTEDGPGTWPGTSSTVPPVVTVPTAMPSIQHAVDRDLGTLWRPRCLALPDLLPPLVWSVRRPC